MEFSILMPVYKAEEYLARSVESVLAQDYNDYELLLVEDGSPDNSGQLCDMFARQYGDRIRVLHCPHRGTIPTRREAIHAARGEFILWLDSDDLMEEGTLSFLHALRADAGDPDMILYEFTAFYDDKRPDDRRPPLFEDRRCFTTEEEKKPLYELYIQGNYLDSLWTKAVRTSLFQADPTDYGPYLSNPYGEDALHGLYPLTHATKIIYTTKPLCRYRMRNDSVMHVFDKSRLEQRFNTGKFAFFKPFMKQWGLWDKEHFTKLKASAYRGVLDGILYFMMDPSYDQAEIKAYAKSFTASHPEIKALSRSSFLAPKQRILFALFAAGRFRIMTTAIRIRRRLAQS